MNNDYAISIYLDTRRAKLTGKFPVKLRVYTSRPRKQKLYPTNFEFSEKEFKAIWETSKPRNEYKQFRKKMQAIETRATKVAEVLSPFTFEQFEKKLYRKENDGTNLKYQYDRIIKEFLHNKKIGTASTYELSQKSLTEFVEKRSNLKYNNVTLFDITPKWLQDYETYMIESKERSLTTVSMYLRALKAIFNRAIDEKEIEKEYYPFGKRKYQVPNASNVKKALSKEQLKTLYTATAANKQQEKARDLWFFSYACNGINTKDIAEIKHKDIQDGKFQFYRAKTRTTSKTQLKPITIYLNSFTSDVIKKYSKPDAMPGDYVFDIISSKDSATIKHAKISNFNRFIGQHLKKMAKDLGLPETISAYWARHSFATNAVRNGATMEFIQESLGHGNLKTTQNYFAGFDSETKQEFSNTIMNFD